MSGEHAKPGPKRTGTVVTTRDGRLQAVVTLVDGSRMRIKPPFPKGTSMAMAKDKAEHWQERVDREGLKRAPKAGKAAPLDQETVSAWFDRWLAQRALEGVVGIRDNRGRFAWHIEPVIGERPIATMTHEDIDAVVDSLNEKVTAKAIAWKTASNVWGLLRKMMRDAVRKKGFRALTANPCDRSEPPTRGEPREFTYLRPAEFLQLVTEPEIQVLWRRMIAVSVYLGLRSSELGALEWSDVDMTMGIVTVRRSLKRNGEGTKAPKAGRAKKVPLPLALRPLFAAMHSPGATGRLFPYRKITGRAEKLREFMKRAGLDRPELYASTDLEGALRWHDLRATTATWHAIDGADAKAIKAIMRHATEKMSEKYIHEAGLYGSTPEKRRAQFGEVFPALPAALLECDPDHEPDHTDEKLSDSGAGHEARKRTEQPGPRESLRNSESSSTVGVGDRGAKCPTFGRVITEYDHRNDSPSARAFRAMAWRQMTGW